jgi:hypothetical protein
MEVVPTAEIMCKGPPKRAGSVTLPIMDINAVYWTNQPTSDWPTIRELNQSLSAAPFFTNNCTPLFQRLHLRPNPWRNR